MARATTESARIVVLVFVGNDMKRNTIYEAELINHTMADLRAYGAKCTLLTNPMDDEIVIRASFPNGKLWEVIDIEDDYIVAKYNN